MKIRIATIALVLLSMLPIPLASAEIPGCRPYYSNTGSGEVWFSSSHSYEGRGSWTDGCGGNACDDSFHGTVAGMTIYVQEISGRNNICVVRCTLDGQSHDLEGYVNAGRYSVEFTCQSWFRGFFTLYDETVSIHIAGTTP